MAIQKLIVIIFVLFNPHSHFLGHVFSLNIKKILFKRYLYF